MTDRSSDNLEQTGIKNTKFEIWCPDLFKKKKKHIVQCFSSDTICISESTGHTLGPEDNNYFVLWLTSMYILGMHYQFLFIQFFVL